MIGRYGILKAWASIFPREANSSVQMLNVGVPCFSNSMASWIHHDMQEPQSPIARITRSHLADNSSKISGEAPEEERGFPLIKVPCS